MHIGCCGHGLHDAALRPLRSTPDSTSAQQALGCIRGTSGSHTDWALGYSHATQATGVCKIGYYIRQYGYNIRT
jgi:hypothetical protein